MSKSPLRPEESLLAPQDIGVPASDPVPGQAQANPVMYAHRMLRGRYWVTIPLMIVLAIPGAIAGFFAVQPQFTSTGLIQVVPRKEKVLYEVPELVMNNFDSFINSQPELITHRRVLDFALTQWKDGELLRAGWPAGEEGITLLQKNISVGVRRGTQVIRLEVKHPDPRLAKAAADAVLHSYMELYGDRRLSDTEKNRQLVALRDRYQFELSAIDTRIRNESQEFGTSDLGDLYRARQDTYLQLDREIGALDLQIELMRSQNEQRLAQNGGVEPDPADVVDIGLDVLAMNDTHLNGLLQQRRTMQSRIDTYRRQFGERHPDMRSLERELSLLDANINEVAGIVRERVRQGLVQGGVAGGNLEQLRQHRTLLDNQRKKAHAELMRIAGVRNRIDAFRQESARVQEHLDDARQRIAQREAEESRLADGHVSIAAYPEMPASPSADRRIPLAVFGAGAGAGLGLGMMFLFGLMTRSYRYLDDLHGIEPSAPLLGTLPEITSGDASSDEMIALAVHHLRNLLHIQSLRTPRVATGADTYAITSPTAGEGKTSLVLALGMSFAVSGQKTIVVDADLVGRGLTRQLGFKDEPGLTDAVEAGFVNGEVVPSKVRNLSVLPAGQLDSVDAENLSPAALSTIIEQLREKYDTVIIDTGPILGSLEANLVSTLSDRVVLCVTRGQREQLVRASLARLRTIGATCAGLVFNRAETADLEKSITSVSFGRQSMRSITAGPSAAADPENEGRKIRRGPLIHAILGTEIDNKDAQAKQEQRKA